MSVGSSHVFWYAFYYYYKFEINRWFNQTEIVWNSFCIRAFQWDHNVSYFISNFWFSQIWNEFLKTEKKNRIISNACMKYSMRPITFTEIHCMNFSALAVPRFEYSPCPVTFISILQFNPDIKINIHVHL